MQSLARDFRTRRFWRHFLASLFAAVGLAAAVLTLWDISNGKWVEKHSTPLECCVIVGSVLFALYQSWPRPIRQSYSSPRTEIRIIEGDLFESEDHIAIGFCDTFGTSTPDIIAVGSLQGQLLERIYGGDLDALNTDLALALSMDVPVGHVSKPGKNERHLLGTVASIRQRPGRRHIYCVALTTMDAQNNASGTVDGLWRSLNTLWRTVSATANGEPVAVPILGSGLARISKILPHQDSVRFIILSFMLASREAPVCSRLDIYVRSADTKLLDMLELQSFLQSLRPS